MRFPGLTITISDLLIIWFFPVLLCSITFFFGFILLYLLLLSPITFLFKQDLEYKIRKKRQLLSGRKVRSEFFYILGLLLLDNGLQATLLYRLSHWFATHHLGLLASICHSFSKFLTHIDISPYAEIGPGLTLYHGIGIVIGKFTRLGSRVTVCQNVTTGSGRPNIGNDVTLWAGAKIIGNVVVGDHAEVGANAVVIKDVPPFSIAVGIPASRIMPKSDQTNKIFTHD